MPPPKLAGIHEREIGRRVRLRVPAIAREEQLLLLQDGLERPVLAPGDVPQQPGHGVVTGHDRAVVGGHRRVECPGSQAGEEIRLVEIEQEGTEIHRRSPRCIVPWPPSVRRAY